MAWYIWVISLNNVFKLYMCCSMNQYFMLFHVWIILSCWIYHILFISWRTFVSTLWILWLMLWTFVYKFLNRQHLNSSWVYIYLRKCAGSYVIFNIWGADKLFSQMATWFYDPTGNVQGFHFCHIFANTCSCLVFLIKIILICLKCYFIMVFICISLENH